MYPTESQAVDFAMASCYAGMRSWLTAVRSFEVLCLISCFIDAKSRPQPAAQAKSQLACTSERYQSAQSAQDKGAPCELRVTDAGVQAACCRVGKQRSHSAQCISQVRHGDLDVHFAVLV